MRNLTLVLVTAGLVTSAACGAGNRPPRAAPATSNYDVARLNALYADAIRRSAVVEAGDALPLTPLVAGPDGMVRVATWSRCPGAAAENRCGSFVPGPVTLQFDAWVGSDDEFRNVCSKLKGDLVLKLAQLIGLPPPQAPVPDTTLEHQFVTFSAPIARIFRPCTDPRVDTTSCSPKLVNPLPANAPPDFYRWFTNQAMSSWQVASPGVPPIGYPWSRLGYTYNWAPEAPTRYGLSEYVVPGASTPVPVTVIFVQTARQFCTAR
jgi:hypothetical protein